MSDRVAKFVSFGKGGDVVYYSANHTCSGYGSPDRPHAAENANIPDGTPVLDTRPATDTDAGWRWAINGPMVDPDLADDAVSECPEPSAVMVAGMSGDFIGLTALQLAHKSSGKKEPGPLDYVSVREHIAGWKRHGARAGKYVGGQIVWEA